MNAYVRTALYALGYIATAVAVLIAAAYVYLKVLWRVGRLRYTNGELVPCLPVSFPLGSATYIRGSVQNDHEIHEAFAHWFRALNTDVYSMFFLHKTNLVFRKMADCEAVLKNKKLNGRTGNPISRYLFEENGIVFLSDIPKWKAHRTIALRVLMRPSYIRTVIETHVVDVMHDAFKWWKSVGAVERKGESMLIDASDSFNRVTAEVIGLSALSQRMGGFATEVDEELERASHAIAKILEAMVVYGTRAPKWWVYEDADFRVFSQAKRDYLNFVQGIIDKRKRENTDENGVFHPQCGDILDSLLEAPATEDPRHFVDTDVKITVADLFGAGSETTGHTLTWCALFLASHRDALERLQEEVDSVFPDKSHPPETSQLNDLVYTEAVINETLRLRPTVAINPRGATEATEVNGIHVPAGTVVWTVFWECGRDEDVYDNPLEWTPQRWIDDPNLPIALNFGVGPRSCIGRNFAMLEAKMALAMFVRNYEFELDGTFDDFVPWTSITVKPHPNVKLWIKPRD